MENVFRGMRRQGAKHTVSLSEVKVSLKQRGLQEDLQVEGAGRLAQAPSHQMAEEGG